jgi:hypothetical protein
MGALPGLTERSRIVTGCDAAGGAVTAPEFFFDTASVGRDVIASWRDGSLARNGVDQQFEGAIAARSFRSDLATRTPPMAPYSADRAASFTPASAERLKNSSQQLSRPIQRS